MILSNRGNREKKESLEKKRKFESTDLPSDPPAPDRRQTALFSHFDKNTVIEKKVSGHHVSLLVFLSTFSKREAATAARPTRRFRKF